MGNILPYFSVPHEFPNNVDIAKNNHCHNAHEQFIHGSILKLFIQSASHDSAADVSPAIRIRRPALKSGTLPETMDDRRLAICDYLTTI